MDLLVDIGNTRLKWCCAERGRCCPAVVQAYDKAGVAVLLYDQWGTLPTPRRVFAANVAGEAVAQAVSEVARALWRLDVTYITADRSAYGVTSGYRFPARLGADRWAALVAAHRLFPGVKYIVDCGSATTVDVLVEDGEHQGGLILPGLTMMRRALLGGTSDLYLHEGQAFSPTAGLLAHETSDAIKGGTLYMMVTALNALVRDLEAQMGCELTRLITGGDAPALLPLLHPGYTHDPDLVLNGLVIIAEGTP